MRHHSRRRKCGASVLEALAPVQRWEGAIGASTDTTIRALVAADIDAYRALRLEALHDSPEAFGASPADEAAYSDADMLLRCAPPFPGVTFGGFHENRLIGMASYVPHQGAKLRHKARMTSVYMKPDWRKAGVGRSLVETIIAHAKAQRVILQCNAAMHNLPARRLYHALGFVPYGVERDALIIGGQSFDEELLMLDLRENPNVVEGPDAGHSSPA